MKKSGNLKNSAKQIKAADVPYAGRNAYGYDQPSPYLFCWSRLFQIVISQAGTYLLTGKFHDHNYAIYKAEGGCNIPGFGELVLGDSGCYFDDKRAPEFEEKAKQVAALITYIVLYWNPVDPVDSMLALAAEYIKVPMHDLKKAVEVSGRGGAGPFGGNCLSSFFRWNPFSEAPIDREYQKFCLINFDGKTEAEVDQKFADEDKGETLLARINEKIKSNPENPRFVDAMCCSPRRNEDGDFWFWINTGRRTVIDGPKTEQEIEEFLAGDGALNDTATY